jgi:ATP-binding protein involved in chromosome partitioning
VGYLEHAAAGPPPVEDIETVRGRVAESLAAVARVVAVTSGKGGVGKSTVAVNLAAALSRSGQRVGILDADLNGPSVAKMLGLRGQPVRLAAGPARGGERLRPAPGPCGLRVQSMDFFLQGNQPLDWDGDAGEGATLRSAMEQAALADLLGYTDWGALDWLVVDLPPGADRLPALARWLPPASAALAVTIPTAVAMLAVERGLRRAHALRFPVIGIVENFASAVCPHCGEEAPLFREAPAEALADATAVPGVARIPFDRRLALAADAGRVFLEGDGVATPAGRALAALADIVLAWKPPDPEGEGW